MKSVIFTIILLSRHFNSHGQEEEIPLTKNVIYAVGGRQSVMGIYYERNKHVSKHVFLAGHIGYSTIQGDDAMPNPQFSRDNFLTTGITGLVGIRPIYFEIGIDPVIGFYDNTTFVNLDGNIGFRIQILKKSGHFFQVCYAPILYTTHHNNFNIPFGMAIGLCF